LFSHTGIAWRTGSTVSAMRTGQTNAHQTRDLVAAGAQLVEVLPEAEYREEHLPGAINIPLKTLDAASAQQLDRTRAVIVYCWDGL
jgi:rhodanese-related sulfurtransferase